MACVACNERRVVCAGASPFPYLHPYAALNGPLFHGCASISDDPGFIVTQVET